MSCGGHFRAWMYEDRRVKKHHVQFESRDRREWWMRGRNVILTINLDHATSGKPLDSSVPFPLMDSLTGGKGESADKIRP